MKPKIEEALGLILNPSIKARAVIFVAVTN